MLSKGYTRLTDAEVFSYYSSDDVIEMVAPRGSVIVEDTRGLHKGREVIQGDRLMLQLQFSISLFGAQYPRGRIESVYPELENMLRVNPEIYENYLREKRA